MAKIDLKFLDCNRHCQSDFIKVEYITGEECIEDEFIRISGIFMNDDEFSIDLDKSTAIKFAKTLRTEINKIQS